MEIRSFLEDEINKRGGKSIAAFFYQKGISFGNINKILESERLTTKTIETIKKVLGVTVEEIINGVKEKVGEEEKLSIWKDFKKEEFVNRQTTYVAIRYLNEIINKYKNKIDLDDPIIKKKIFMIIRQSIILTILQKKEEKEGEGKYVVAIANAAKTLQFAEEDLRWLPKQLELDTGTDTFSEMGKKYEFIKTRKKKHLKEEKALKEGTGNSSVS
ncbi:MAG: hypothetical protein COS89_06880 [Deltaproteobacteria bacterium CG07_land_8_20_14_0_80_38_7]|nr:MAG: hypothetical protein COS89_06880 [Deltaproteobacteria bacterium CG07_land_8_20_14_0_80_38_7]